jgi:hypothetical protein
MKREHVFCHASWSHHPCVCAADSVGMHRNKQVGFHPSQICVVRTDGSVLSGMKRCSVYLERAPFFSK